MSVISKTISNSSTSTNEHPLWSSRSHSRLNSFSGDKDGEASLIFERNVEDPNFLSQSSRPVSRPVSRAMSRSASRNVSRPLSRQQSQATISFNQGIPNNVTNYTSANIIHKPLPTKRNSSFSFTSPSNDLRRYSTNPNNNTNNISTTSIGNVTSSQIRRVKTGNPQLYSQSYNNSSTTNCNCNNNTTNNDSNNNNNGNYLHTLENFVPPALDESCSIVTDVNTKLDDVDMIYSKRPSTLGLDMALGRTRSSSTATPRAQSTHNLGLNSPVLASRQTSSEQSSSPSPSSRLLRFYSYVDMLSDENLQQQQAQAQQQQTQQQRPDFISHYSYSNDNTTDNLRKKPLDNRVSPSPIQNISDTSTSGSSSSFFINPFMRNKKTGHNSNDRYNSKKHQLKNKPSDTLKALRSKFHLHSDSGSSSQDDDEEEENENEGPNYNNTREKSPKCVPPTKIEQDELYPDNNEVATIVNSNKNEFVSDFNYDDLNDDDRLQKEKVSEILRRRVSEQQPIPFNSNDNNNIQGHGYLDNGSDPITK
ncbi:hypothetical protein C6P45_001834 [Maudiozyma exigua]|uniref:Uncharacterized protein n=1 Tax=Maudiozyma exigua TaxID=34358 RepID=A0A9P6W187_MAUEX|nr:hypothetical protein C6P45_001834 [Kazachstania exigua]